MELGTFDLAVQAIVGAAFKALAVGLIGFGLFGAWELIKVLSRRG
jgi:hypothetical protein